MSGLALLLAARNVILIARVSKSRSARHSRSGYHPSLFLRLTHFVPIG